MVCNVRACGEQLGDVIHIGEHRGTVYVKMERWKARGDLYQKFGPLLRVQATGPKNTLRMK
jgi:hypothetical protein